jgi:hypothetical protein
MKVYGLRSVKVVEPSAPASSSKSSSSEAKGQ